MYTDIDKDLFSVVLKVVNEIYLETGDVGEFLLNNKLPDLVTKLHKRTET